MANMYIQIKKILFIFIILFCINFCFAGTNMFITDESKSTIIIGNIVNSIDGKTGDINFFPNLRRYPVGASTFKAPGTNPATYTNIGLDGAWKFANGLQENISFTIAIPDSLYIGSPISIRLGCGCVSTTGNFQFKMTYSYVETGESINNITSDEILYSTTNVSTTSYGYSYANFNLIPPTINDKYMQVIITRLGNIDTCNADVYVIGLSLLYYVNRFGDQ